MLPHNPLVPLQMLVPVLGQGQVAVLLRLLLLVLPLVLGTLQGRNKGLEIVC